MPLEEAVQPIKTFFVSRRTVPPGAKRVYRITEQGRATLDELMADLRSTTQYLTELVSAYDQDVHSHR